ncbi:MAG: hypothetical protein H6698_03105 [Myxococcales bacterium]|nr:hypothetical protein [Myxococcales bacterium]MCB9533302.1 hypothetical protein [Myxococcales bacterium]
MATPESDPRNRWLAFFFAERVFLGLLALGFAIAALTYRTPHIAMWVGFAFAGYSAVANDSIQTIGTFIASNGHRRWWVLWLFVGGVFLATMTQSWLAYDGDVSSGRLASKGFAEAPTEFAFLQIAAPLFLMVITRMRMPVSTTMLLLSSFATHADGITQVLQKSVIGYVYAFVIAILVWGLLGRVTRKLWVGAPHPAWSVAQWFATAYLWSMWLQQDAANIAVYLPRSLSLGQFVAFSGVIFVGLGLLFYQRGERIQEVVNEKTAVVDVRPATMIDFVYGSILYYFKVLSPTPMSTTWVFIGLLGGRELILAALSAADGRTVAHAARMMVKDLVYVSIGLVVSMLLATAINPVAREAYLPDWLGGGAADVSSPAAAPTGDAGAEPAAPSDGSHR